MVKKEKTPSVREAIIFDFHKILKVVSLDDVKIIDKLEGEEKRKFLKFCHETFNDPFFDIIFKNYLHSQVYLTANEAVTPDQYVAGQNMCLGMFTIFNEFQKQATEYDKLTQPQEKFNEFASFNKPNVG